MIDEPEVCDTKNSTDSYNNIVFTRLVLVCSITILFEALIIGGIFSFLPILLKQELGINIGFFFMVTSIFVIVCRILASHLSDRYGRGPMFFYPFLALILSVVLISGMKTMAMLLTSAILYGIGTAICTPTLTALLADHSEPHQRGSIYSFFYGSFDIGMIIAGITLGFFADLYGLRSMFLISAGIGLLAAIIFMLFILPGYKKSICWTITGGGK